jgi:hypothetical protein
MGDAAVEDDDASDRYTKLGAIAAMTRRGPTTRILERRRGGVRGSRDVIPPVKPARCCRAVSGFPYANDMRQLVRIGGCVC